MRSDINRFVRITIIAVIALLIVPAGLMAQIQASTGQILGRITDSTGAAIPGATVTVSDKSIGVQRTTTSNEEGLYRFVLLPAGSYVVEVSAKGFARAKTDKVQVEVGRGVDLPISLSVGSTEQMVEVTTEAVQVSTEHPDSFLNQKAIDGLPINGRRFHDFVTLTPTAQVEPSRNQISLSGQRGINGTVNIDGQDYSQPFFGGIRGGERSNNAYTVPQESIREFQVVNAGYNAEFGRSTGGLVTAITKSGTNNIHGSAFYVNRDKSLARSNAFLDTLAASPQANGREITIAPSRHQWGGSIGGPIKKDKLFFFGTYEGQKESQHREVLFDKLVGFTPTATNQEAYDYYTGLQTGYTQTNDAWAYLIKGDYQITDNNRLSVRYNQSWNEGKNATSAGTSLFPTNTSALSNNGTEQDRSKTVTGQLSTIFSPTMANELRGQWTKEWRPRLANDLSPDVASTVGSFGTVTFLPTTEEDYRVQFSDNITVQKGAHTFKFGGELNYTNAGQFFKFNQFGTYSLGGGTTASQLTALSTSTGLNRFDLMQSGSPNIQYRLATGNGLADMAAKNLSFFAQDSWKLLSNLTINAGLRYDATFNPSPNVSNTALYDTVKNAAFPRGIRNDPAIIPDQTNEWGPRIGFAWDPFKTGKTVVRGYSGIYYAATPLLLYAGPVNNFRSTPGDLSITLPFATTTANKTLYQQFLLAGIDLNSFTLDNLPVLTLDQVQTISTALGLSPVVWNGSSPISIANNFKDPRSIQAGLGMEREIVKDLNVGVDFTYVNTSYLQRNRDMNLPTPTTDINGRLIYVSSTNPRPVATLFQAQQRESTARSLFRAGTIRASLRKKWGQLNAFYTLSENLSDDDNERDSGGPGYMSVDDLRSEYNYSRLDAKHQFVANPVIFLPWKFELSSGIRIRSGVPFNAINASGSDINNDGNRNDRPLQAVGVVYKRNSWRQPMTSTVDFRVQKTFGLRKEGMQLKVFADFFNLFNRMNLQYASTSTFFCSSNTSACGLSGVTNVDFMQFREQDQTKSNFGQLLLGNNPGNPFQAQFGVRFEF
ncbi:MAG: carboxypeptidase regulatory-like domain-containing protein [Acidobacteriaceae bacterium]